MDKYRSKVINIFIVAILTLFAIISIFPFYWNLSAAFTPVSKIFTYPPPLIPVDFTLDNFFRLDKYFPYFVRNILNSFFLAAFIPLFSVFFNSLAGFAFAKMNFKGRKFLFIFVLATILIPSSSGYIPLFIQMSKLKLVDNYLAVILPGMASAFGVFLFKQSMYAVPNELLDAGRIDGAGNFSLYRIIVVPTIRPMMITIYIGGFIGVWNDYFWPFIILSSQHKLTFPIVLAGIQGQVFEAPWGIIMVGALILTAPTILIYSTLSKYIVPDIFGGSIKG